MITSSHATNPLIRIFRNSDQRIDVLLKTIDRTAVILQVNEVIRFRVFDREHRKLLQSDCQISDLSRGHYYTQLSAEQTGGFPLGLYTWDMVIFNSTDNTEKLIFADKDYGANSPLRVLEGPVPDELPSQTINPETLTNGLTSALVGAAQTRNLEGVHSIVLALDDYTGTVVVNATLDDDIPMGEEWTPVVTEDLAAVTGNHHIAVTGHYTWLQIYFSTTTGLTNITYRNL